MTDLKKKTNEKSPRHGGIPCHLSILSIEAGLWANLGYKATPSQTINGKKAIWGKRPELFIS